MLDFIKDLLRSPEAQRDPGAWAATLLAHAMICNGLAAFLPWWVVVAGYALWEGVQWRKYGADAWDCLLDWSGASLGVCVAAMSYPGKQGAVLALVVVLLVGVRKRR